MGAGAQVRVERMGGGRGGGMVLGAGVGGLGSGGGRGGGGVTFAEAAGDLEVLAFGPVVVVWWCDVGLGGGSGGCEVGDGGGEGEDGEGLVEEMHGECGGRCDGQSMVRESRGWDVCGMENEVQMKILCGVGLEAAAVWIYRVIFANSLVVNHDLMIFLMILPQCADSLTFQRFHLMGIERRP